MQYTYGSRRHLPHLERPGATYFVTFATLYRRELPDAARDLVLQAILHEHRVTSWLHCAVVMPDHVHLVVTIFDEWRVSAVMQRVKSVSAHRVNRLLNRRGALWHDESFDRLIRRDESLRQKSEYIAQNPSRKGLVTDLEDYRWLWREWIEGRR